jgi:hypothetical protein
LTVSTWRSNELSVGHKRCKRKRGSSWSFPFYTIPAYSSNIFENPDSMERASYSVWRQDQKKSFSDIKGWKVRLICGLWNFSRISLDYRGFAK